MPAKITFKANDPVRAQYGTFGVLAQDVVEFNKYVKGVFWSSVFTNNYKRCCVYQRYATLCMESDGRCDAEPYRTS
ncbi:hypothetical protein QW060_25650 [Myroides ceti]|uniref:Uncharacterized protein n=1 Tax=Paenimyroides ceti TaxID=395087 RepID=A0ABT8D470_9FLAO|nr:hypothetical protein [Paenimyroides ceti]MDN3710245.1 hypothetical protein [Paenimyroides ceti]